MRVYGDARTALVSPKDLKQGDQIIVVDRNINLVPIYVGRITPIKRDGKVVAYKVYPQRWLDDEAKVAADASLKHFAPKTYTTRDKVEKVVTPAR